MNKKDLATVLVRFAGLYFTYLAVKKVAAVMWAVWLVSSILSSTEKGMDISDKVSLSTALSGAISFFITAGIAYYLLRKGTWLVEFLCKDSTNTPNET